MESDKHEIKYPGYRTKNLERIALRLGLSFYIDDTSLIQLSEYYLSREATNEEQQMWRKLVPNEFNPEYLPASPEEIVNSFIHGHGPFTVNSIDYNTLSKLGNSKYFYPYVNKESIQKGIFGFFRKYFENSTSLDVNPERIPIYVSSRIQVGYFYDGTVIPETTEQMVFLNLKPFVIFNFDSSMVNTDEHESQNS
jgi:hypothetical protein